MLYTNVKCVTDMDKVFAGLVSVVFQHLENFIYSHWKKRKKTHVWYIPWNFLSLDCSDTRVGSGGYDYTSELPGDSFNSEHVLVKNMWEWEKIAMRAAEDYAK